MPDKSKYRFGCGETIEQFIPTRWGDYKSVMVECGSTSIYGDPWQCEKCAEIFKHVNYREDAAEYGESYDDPYFFEED